MDGLEQQIQMDVVDMSKFSYKKKGNRWILTVIEVLSRYAFAIPVWWKNTESMTKAVEKVLAQFKEDSADIRRQRSLTMAKNSTMSGYKHY